MADKIITAPRDKATLKYVPDSKMSVDVVLIEGEWRPRFTVQVGDKFAQVALPTKAVIESVIPAAREAVAVAIEKNIEARDSRSRPMVTVHKQ